MCCACCFNACRPRYKILVDNIFPVNPQDGLVRNNMEKLTFYAMSSPEKLDRIGEYLAQKLNKNIYRRQKGFVTISMEALDQILLTCHAQTLNLFVESFLKMVQKLLECTEPDLQILATQSFVKFANIEEDTPSYHRGYDFFVSKFSSMCHSNEEQVDVRTRVRLAGIKGLQGVVRKTVNDDLQVNIWDQTHMDKIIPSLLFNMHADGRGDVAVSGGVSGNNDEMPAVLAEACLRDLLCRAAFGNIKSVLKPVLRHLHLHELWTQWHCDHDFPIRLFKIVTYAVQAQYSVGKKYTVSNTTAAYASATGLWDPLLRIALTEDPATRRLTQQILHALIDRHKNNDKFATPSIVEDIEDFGLSRDKCSRPDYMFMKKHGGEFLYCCYDSLLKSNNELDNFSAIYQTLALLAVEFQHDELLIEFLRIAFSLQELAQESHSWVVSMQNTGAVLHGIIASYLSLITKLIGLSAPITYVEEVIESRRKSAPYLLPDFVFGDENADASVPNPLDVKEDLLFKQSVMVAALKQHGHDTTRLSIPYTQNAVDSLNKARSMSDIKSISLTDADSAHSSPGIIRKNPEEDITFESLKMIMFESPEKAKALEEERQRRIVETFRTAPFEDIVARSEAKTQQIHDRLGEILSKIQLAPIESQAIDRSSQDSLDLIESVTTDQQPVYEMTYPELFVY
ncbi:PREDICTED: protein EFR3 homolog B-like [Priapulus caudatus]|uniref:Protein EFR3 homolog B-like n=1 Tax=Priapulus caudatus TaxID=37621 RepID=A0ABM1FBM6_PRICU|nr:PREDICTED: protein EFR3 homolog B-like [Priapulus caudatus]